LLEQRAFSARLMMNVAVSMAMMNEDEDACKGEGSGHIGRLDQLSAVSHQPSALT
jgi:hypothetical protein